MKQKTSHSHLPAGRNKATARRAPYGVALALCATGIATSLVGCSSPTTAPKLPTAQEAQYAELRQRPDIDQALEHYSHMLGLIRDPLTSALALPAWQQREGSESDRGCSRAFPDVARCDVVIVHPATWYTPDRLTLPRWEQAKAIVQDIGARSGITTIDLTSDSSSNFQLVLRDDNGAELSFSAGVNVVLSLTTACHLTKKAFNRGTPQPSSR